MYRQASITVYLSLVLAVMITMLAAAFYSADRAGARVMAAHSMDQSLYSLFARFDRDLLENYHLFFIDGGMGGSSLSRAGLCGWLEADGAEILKNGRGNDRKMQKKLKLDTLALDGYTLATDGGGNPVKKQAVAYMKSVLGIQDVESLLNKLQEDSQEVGEGEAEWTAADVEEKMKEYENLYADRELSIEDIPEAEEPQEVEAEYGDGSVTDSPQEDRLTENPVEVMKPFQGEGALSLLLPTEASLSQAFCDPGTLLSEREKNKGLGRPTLDTCDSMEDKILFNEYLLQHLSCFTSQGQGQGLRYQLEYIVAGKHGDIENLKRVLLRLLSIREGANLLHLLRDSERQREAEAVGEILALLCLAPEAKDLFASLVLISWSLAESIVDIRGLLDGKKVPLVKAEEDWKVPLAGIPLLLSGGGSFSMEDSHGLDYQGYLRLVLYMNSGKTALIRGMDMIEKGMQQIRERENFRLDNGIYSLTASFSFSGNKGMEWRGQRSYSYREIG